MVYNIVTGRDKSDKEKFGNEGLIYLGKGYVKMGNYTSLSNNIYMDIARTHVMLVAGKRGSGKSYTLSVIAEELSNLPPETSKNIASIIYDTMGIFWTMKFKNEKEKGLLNEWNLKPKKIPVKIFVPYGKIEEYRSKSIPFDKPLALKASELQAEDWISVFNIPFISEESILIQKSLGKLKDKDFSIEDILEEINHQHNVSQQIKNTASALFEAADSWGIFAKKSEKNPTEISNLAEGGKIGRAHV